jgi:HD-like signal output (HDOD) protein
MSSEQSLASMIYERVESGGQDMPIFNRVALKLQQVLKDEDTTVNQIEKLILQDQVLAGHVLRSANSAFFAGLNSIGTIREAIIRLGIKQVASLVMLEAQKNVCSSKNPIIQEYMPGLWGRAYVSAITCRWVLECCGFKEIKDEGFLAGLLHDIGQLFLLKIMEEIANELESSNPLSDTVIKEVIESMHNEQGYQLLKNWNLEEVYCVVARDHHNPFSEEDGPLLQVVRLVDQGCSKVGVGCDPDESIVLAVTEEAMFLGISEIQLAEMEVLLEDAAAKVGLGAGE